MTNKYTSIIYVSIYKINVILNFYELLSI